MGTAPTGHRTRRAPRFHVLGAVGVRSSDGEAVGLSPQLRRLLAALLVNADEVVSVDRLADVVWGDAPPEHVNGAVQTLVSRLRAALRDSARGQPDRSSLATRAPGYALHVTDDLDAARFRLLVDDARSRRADPTTALRLLDDALALWEGPAYAGYADEPFARAAAVRLEELRVVAEQERAAALSDVGRHDDAVAALESIVARHPLREPPHAQLMRVLHHAGRTTDALTVYRDLRTQMRTELGLDPSDELADLHTRLLRREPMPRPAPGRDEEPGPETRPHPHGARAARGAAQGNVPEPTAPLIGRETTVDAIGSLLSDARLVTVTGPGGVGKTAVAMEVARRTRSWRPDGVWVCELAVLTPGDEITDVLATVLDVPRQATATAPHQLVDVLRTMDCLLVLDGCEHLREQAAAAVTDVLRRCPTVTVLATSREPLGVPGEHVRSLPPLPVADGHDTGPAVELFIDRARAAGGLTLTDDIDDDVVGLCRRLDGLPLALELAAMRMRALTPAELLRRLDDRPGILRSTAPTTAARHRTLESLVDWSYRTLDDAERSVFRVLSVFAADCSLTSAEALAAHAGIDATTVVDAVTALVDKSLLTIRHEDGATRIGMLEMMRGYGRARLDERGTAARLHRGHAQWMTELAERAAVELWRQDQVRWIDTLTGEIAELRAAHGWASTHDPPLARTLVAALAGYAELRASTEIYRWAERSAPLDGPVGAPPAAWAVAQALAAAGARSAGDLTTARRRADRALTVDDAPMAHRLAWYVHGDLAVFEGRLDDVLAAGQRLRAVPASARDGWLTEMSVVNEALAHAYAGRRPMALAIAERLVRACGPGDPPNLQGWAQYCVAEAVMEDAPARAAAHLEEALASARSTRDRFLLGVSLISAAAARVRMGDDSRALQLFAEVIAHWRQLGNRMMLWTALRHAVVLLARRGAWLEAATIHGVLATRDTAAPVYGMDRIRLDAVREELLGQLGDDGWAAAEARGRQMTDEEAIRLATTVIVAERIEQG